MIRSHDIALDVPGAWQNGTQEPPGKSVEGVWSLFKRSIVGSFQKMSVKHMDRYLEELEWGFNNRDNPHIFRDTLARIVHTDPLAYRDLIA